MPSEAPRRGRRARHAEHAAPLPLDERPVWRGLPGGRYKPLSDAEVARVHETALTLLDDIGLASAIPEMVDLVGARGGRLTDQGRLLFPRALVEEVIAGLRRDVVLHGQRPGQELDLSDARVHVGSGGASPNIVDLETGRYREATLKDLYDVARLVDALDHIHFYNRSLVARDVADPVSFDVNTAYAIMCGTSKPLGTSFSEPESVRRAFAMFCHAAGGRERFLAKPFCTLLSCHVVPPLRFAEDACRSLAEGVRLGLPVQLVAAGQAGATAPAPLAGSVAMSVAETLAGAVFCYLIDPRAQVILAPKPLVSDLRTGSMSGGSGEQAVLMAASAQMINHYGLPSSVMAGMTDSKIPDAQHGYEKGYTVTLAAHAGANYISQSCGMQASLLGCSFEGYVIDNDMLGAILRTVRGLEVNDETLSIETVREVVSGPGHFLGHPQTIAGMTRDYLYPQVADRASPSDWEDRGASDIRQRAIVRTREILGGHFPDHVPEAADKLIRDIEDIALPRRAMGPALAAE